MWRRDDEKEEEKKVNAESPDARREASPGTGSRAGRRGGEEAVIGSSIKIRGEVEGDQDLVIQGEVDGSVNLDQNSVTVGPDGDVTADITGRIITVEGHVEGDLTADEQIVLRDSARVEGDISAPRVVLEDGARFRGGVEMGESAERSRQERKSGKKRSGSSGGKGKGSESDGSSGSKAKAASGKGSGGSGASGGDGD